VLCSSAPWNPRQIQFPGIAPNEQEEIEVIEVRNIQSVKQEHNSQAGEREEDALFDIAELRKRIMSSATITFEDVDEKREKRRIEALTQASLPPIVSTEPLEEHETMPIRAFLSKDRHSRTAPEELSERWGLSIAQAALTLKATTRRLVRSALMPLARRHRVDRVFEPNRLSGIFATDTMDVRCDSTHDERCCQVFANKDFFAAACPMEKKGGAHEPVNLFVQDHGAPDTLISDGAKEQVGRNSKFQAKLRKCGVKHKTSEKERPNQNPSEGAIREVRKRWHRLVFGTNCPRKLWNHGPPHVCAVMRLTASCAGRLQGRTPLEAATGETPDISEHLDFGFCDPVWFKENAGLGEMQLGRYLGVDHSVGSLMGHKVPPRSGMPVSRTTAQRVTELEKSTEANKTRITSCDSATAERFKEERLAKNGHKPDPAAWAGVIETDPDFAEEFASTFDNSNTPEADDGFHPDSFDTHLDMGLVLDRRPGAEPEFARVTKRLRDKDGNLIGKANDNPVLDTRLHEVEHLDGHKAALSANLIAESIVAQVDSEGHRELLMDEIIGHRTDGNEAQELDAFVEAKNGVKRR
jgi:hypothetical protein